MSGIAHLAANATADMLSALLTPSFSTMVPAKKKTGASVRQARAISRPISVSSAPAFPSTGHSMNVLVPWYDNQHLNLLRLKMLKISSNPDGRTSSQCGDMAL